jgi:hypothetical protein
MIMTPERFPCGKQIGSYDRPAGKTILFCSIYSNLTVVNGDRRSQEVLTPVGPKGGKQFP